jgi:SAM-dependent methyltransferase
MNTHTDPQLIAQLDAAWGDEQAWTAEGLHWLHLDPLRARNNRQVSGDATVDALDWLARHVARAGESPFQRALVLGCGDGWLERGLRGRELARTVVAMDLSPRVLDRARKLSAGVAGITYVQADMNHLPIGSAPFRPRSFDAVLGWSSVHHCSDLEQLYPAVHALLRPGGWLFLDEYVGPDYFQFSEAHMDQVRMLARLLPERLRTTRSGFVRSEFQSPTVAEVQAVDPSEAAASSRILPLLDSHFEVIAKQPYGGSLLHVLLAHIAQNFQSPEGAHWLQALIAAEDDLHRQGVLEQHFCSVIARRPPAASSRPSRGD